MGGALTTTLATQHEMKPKQVKAIIDSLVSVGTAEVKKTGIFTIPGLCRIKTRVKPARKAGKRMAFGKVVTVSRGRCESFPCGSEEPNLKSFLFKYVYICV